MIGVVIPFFQRTPGLLNRALRSVAAQTGAPEVRVFVVDDSSPIPPEDELCGLPQTFVDRIEILRQPNAGPGAARNTALDRMHAGFEVAAFLDSDDAWTADHLARAAVAMAAGADFYFADHRRQEHAENRFAECGYSPDGVTGPSGPSHGAEGLFWCSAEAVFKAIVKQSPVGTSTVAIRRSRIGANRFSLNLRSAGEDSVFWLEVLAGGARPACSMRCEAHYGQGVSVFNHRSWGDAHALRTTLDEMRAQHHLRTRFVLDRDLLARSRAQSGRMDLSFCASLIACARRLQWSAAAPALTYVGQRPWALLRLPEAVGRAVRQRLSPMAD